MVQRRGKRWGFEFKYSDAPVMSKSMHVALSDLKLECIFVVYPGSVAYPLHRRAEALPPTQIYKRFEDLRLSNIRAARRKRMGRKKQ